VQYLEIDHFREDLLCTRKHTKDDFLLSAAIAPLRFACASFGCGTPALQLCLFALKFCVRTHPPFPLFAYLAYFAVKISTSTNQNSFALRSLRSLRLNWLRLAALGLCGFLPVWSRFGRAAPYPDFQSAWAPAWSIQETLAVRVLHAM